MNEMNSDEGVSQVMSQHKKMILLHNERNAWLAYISKNWADDRYRSEHNVKNWIQIIDRIRSTVEQK